MDKVIVHYHLQQRHGYPTLVPIPSIVLELLKKKKKKYRPRLGD